VADEAYDIENDMLFGSILGDDVSQAIKMSSEKEKPEP
jgi:hypothetical protein